MPIIIDIRKDLRYKAGFKEGFKEGLEETRNELRLTRKQGYIVAMLKKDFRPLELIAECVEESLTFVKKTKKAYLRALPLLEDKNTTLETISKKTGLMLEVVERLKKNMG
jgi:lipoate synthase